MKKKETILVILMGIITVAVIFMGFSYNKNRQAALMDPTYKPVSQGESFEDRQKKKEEEKRKEFIAAFDEKREESTVADFLQYVKYGKGDTAVTFYGEIEDQAPWAVENMTNLANERAFSEMKVQFLSQMDSEEELEAQVASLVETNPDVVFYHTPLPVNGIVDWTVDGEPIEENNINEVFAAYDAMKEKLPETLIVLVTPLPESAVETEDGTLASAHQEGIDELMATSEEYSLPVFNLHDQTMGHLAGNSLTIEGMYDENGNLTEETRLYVSQAFSQNLKELRVDTTSAYHLDGEPAEIDIVIEVYEEEESSSSEEVIEEEPSEEVIEEEWSEEEWTEDEWSEEQPVWEEPEEEEYVPWTPPADESSTAPAPTPPTEPVTPPVNPPTEPVTPPVNPPTEPVTPPVDPPNEGESGEDGGGVEDETQPPAPVEPPAYEESE